MGWQNRAESGESNGLTLAQVDARISAGVADWAEAGNTDNIAADKITVKRKTWFATRGALDPTEFYGYPAITDLENTALVQDNWHLLQPVKIGDSIGEAIPLNTLNTHADADADALTLPAENYNDGGADRFFRLDGTFTIEAYLDVLVTDDTLGPELRLVKVNTGIDDVVVARGRGSRRTSSRLDLKIYPTVIRTAGVSLKTHLPITFTNRADDYYYLAWRNSGITIAISFSMSIYEE